MLLALDVETALSRQGCLFPPLTCVQLYSPVLGPRIDDAQVYSHRDAEEVCAWALEQELTGHGIAYDMGVLCAEFPALMPRVFKAYRENRVHCTMVRQKLIDIAAGNFEGWIRKGDKPAKVTYDLEQVAWRHLGIEVDKAWQIHFGQLRDVSLSEWPAAAMFYAKNDVFVEYQVDQSQERSAVYLEDQYRQDFTGFCLGLVSGWGVTTDAQAVERLIRAAHRERDRLAGILRSYSLLRPDRELKSGPNKGALKKGSRDTKAVQARVKWAYESRGLPVPLTAGGDVATDGDTCDDSGDEVLKTYGEYLVVEHKLSTEIKIAATQGRIHTRYIELQENGRTASAKRRFLVDGGEVEHAGNLQNMPRVIPEWCDKDASGEPRWGVRECYAPPPGYLYASVDYEQIELRTLAQVCIKMLGYSRLGELLNGGLDPHLEVGARILGLSYDEAKARKKEKAVKDARQAAKPINFGLPGGLGARTMVTYAKKNYGVILTEDQAKGYKSLWFETYPEMRPYLNIIGRIAEDPHATIEQLFSRRFRGGVGYCDAANTLFSGLAADLGKAAIREITEACYLKTSSALWGSRLVLFTHDEFVCEVPEHRAHEAAEELCRVAIAAAQPWLPDIKVTAEPVLARRYSKAAETLRDASGRLVPWEVRV